jgi:hypothetical protein
MASGMEWLGNYENCSCHFSHSGKAAEQSGKEIPPLKVGWIFKNEN